jgi:hypothetical protein
VRGSVEFNSWPCASSLSPPVPCPRLLLPPLKREREKLAEMEDRERERTRLGESILYRPGQARRQGELGEEKIMVGCGD